MGVAYSFSDDFDKAIESFASAAKVIEEKIANLEKQQKEKLSWTEEQKKKDGENKFASKFIYTKSNVYRLEFCCIQCLLSFSQNDLTYCIAY